MKKSLNILALGALLLSASIANASTVYLNFTSDTPASGSLIYGGGAGVLTGTDLQIQDINGMFTGPSITCASCRLAFTTGAETNGADGSWSWAAGGTISIIGAAPAAGISDINTTLMSGTLGATEISSNGFGGFTLNTIGAEFIDTKDPLLTAYFGLPGGAYEGALSIDFSLTGISEGSAFSVTDTDDTNAIESIDVDNAPVVPVPAAVWLFGSGLLGLVGVARRKKA